MTPLRVSLDIPPIFFAVRAALANAYAIVTCLQTPLSGCRPGYVRHRRPSRSQYWSLNILPVRDLVVTMVPIPDYIRFDSNGTGTMV